METINNFIHRCHKRLWTGRCLNIVATLVLCWLTILVIISLPFVLRGYAVNLSIVLYTTLVAVLVFFVSCFIVKPHKKTVACFCDKHFDLKDSVITAIEFDQNQGSSVTNQQFKALQLDYTRQLCSKQDVSKIEIIFPKRRFLTSLVLVVLTLFLCSMDASEAVQKQLNEEERIEKVSSENKKELLKDLKEVQKELTEKEQKELESTKLKALIEKLKQTKNKKEALREYAKIEQELRKMLKKNKLREDQKLLAELQRQLQKSQNMKELAKMLKREQYKEAGKKMKEMKVDSKRSLAEQKKMNDKLKELARKMKESADLMKANSSSLKKDFNDLQNASEALAKALEKAMQEQNQNMECSDEVMQQCNSNCKSCNDALDKISGKIVKMGSKGQFMKKMMAMQQSVAKAQSKMLGLSQMPSKKPGMASAKSVNKTTTAVKPAYNSQLTGTKGKGKSTVQNQTSQSGTGAITKAARQQKSIEFKKQVESFIGRTDIPHAMRNGVKEYFKIVHEQGE